MENLKISLLKLNAMKYVIYSNDRGQLVKQNSSLERVFETRLPRLAGYFSNYTNKPRLEIRINFHADQVRLSYLINMRSKPVHVYGKGENVLDLAKELFNRLELVVARQRQIERQQFLRIRKRWQLEGFKEHLDALNKIKEQDDKSLFVQRLQSLMPDIQAHIKKQIKQELAIRELPMRTLDFQDFVSEFYLRVFEHFDDKPAEWEKVAGWLYDEANTLLKDKLAVLDKRADHGFLPYEDLERANTREMSEEFTVDAEGELVMVEDLDDYESGDVFEDIIDESVNMEELSEES
jgi:ribosome-associated translation inhibitor RaiA